MVNKKEDKSKIKNMKRILSLSALLFIAAFIIGGCGAVKPIDSNVQSVQNEPVEPAILAPEPSAPISGDTSTADTATIPVDSSSEPLSSDNAFNSEPTIATSVSVVAPVEVVPVNIDISGYIFSPDLLKIKKGTTVVWTNNNSVPHQIRSATFNSDLLQISDSFSFTFKNTGIFTYSSSVHPSMTGKIIVE